MARIQKGTDRPRQAPKSRFWPRFFGTISVGALVLAPVAALSLWLLMSDPVTAAAIMERGSILPLFAALAKMVGKAIMAALTTL
jgi:hypothetical protein